MIYGRIKPGTPIFQDFGFGEWPCVAGGKVADPDTRFRFTCEGAGIKAVAHGYGEIPGKYGNGAIFIRERLV
jgi:hypothetical protein